MYPIDNLHRGWRRRAGALAIEDGTRGLTYAELVERVEALAAALQARWPRPQARIGICGYNTIEHVVAILAVYAAGHTWVALNPRNGKPELDAIIGSTRLDLVVADENCLDRFTLPAAPLILGKTDGTRNEDTIASLIAAHRGRRPRRHELPLTAAQTIKFTGGSTGRPKGVVQSYRCVNTSIVFGVPDAKWGERVEAAIQLKPGRSFDEAEIVAFLKARVGAVKTPKKIHVAESLPRSAVGKVLRREARKLFAAESPRE